MRWFNLPISFDFWLPTLGLPDMRRWRDMGPRRKLKRWTIIIPTRGAQSAHRSTHKLGYGPFFSPSVRSGARSRNKTRGPPRGLNSRSSRYDTTLPLKKNSLPPSTITKIYFLSLNYKIEYNCSHISLELDTWPPTIFLLCLLRLKLWKIIVNHKI